MKRKIVDIGETKRAIDPKLVAESLGAEPMVRHRKLKVWGGTDFFEGKQCRLIVAATTKKRAAELIKYSTYSFNTWMEETGNDIELAVATEEGVWYTKNEYKTTTTKDYKRVEDKEI